ncbi:MAG: hypothetical protein ACRC80_21685, partial [Waterburya sp.]
ASEWISETQKEEQIQRAIWLVMAANHKGMEAGKTYGANKLHDHRFMTGMPGMGWMGDIEGVEHLNHDQGGNKPEMMHHQMNHGQDNSEMMNHQMNHGQDQPKMMQEEQPNHQHHNH